jgi:hypothetical protein
MGESALQINGRSVARAQLFVPNEGVWFCDADLTDDAPLTGAVSITLGATTLKGTVDDGASGVFGLRRRVRILGGAAGWRKEIKPLGYHNDAGVKASTVASDAAKACGETMGTFAGGVQRLGADYLRNAGPAARTIEDAARGVPWWVGYDGVTHVAARTEAEPSADAYSTISYDPKRNSLQLQIEDLQAVGIGSRITKDLTSPLVIASFELEVTPERMRMHAWVGQGRGASALRALRALVERTTDKRITWPCRYRVVDRVGDRVDLQIVKKGTGAPDALSVPLWPGIAGAHIISAKGAEVIVQFVDGDRSDPIVTGFAGRGSNGAIPKRLVLGATSGEGQDAARKGDVIEILLPPFAFSGTIGGSPAAGMLTAVLPRALGSIISGAPGVGIGNDAAAQ